MADKPCTLLVHSIGLEPPQIQQLKNQFENGTDNEKIETLKKVILLVLNGEALPQLIMHVIRFVMPTKNHTIKKLLLIYWEIVNKKSADGKLLHEMILVCNGLMQDLQHPNEYIRGSTLRFLCKLKEAELLEPLIPAIRQNLEHRHSYVRRNAVLAVYSIFKDFPQLLSDAPDLIYEFLTNEGDPSCKRNAFIMLFNCAQDRAIKYLNSVLDEVAGFGEILQLIVIEVIKKVWRQDTVSGSQRVRYMKALFTLLSSGGRDQGSGAVQYESALCLVQLSSAPTAIHQASLALIRLLCTQSDNNVKMIVLDRLTDIKLKYRKTLQELVMDILRALSSPNLEIRKKTLEIALDLITPHNIVEVMGVLKKEIHKSQSGEGEGQATEDAAQYRQLLIRAVHQCAIKFPEVAGEVVHMLLDLLTTADPSTAQVVDFVRQVVASYPQLRGVLVHKLTADTLPHVIEPRVCRAVLWIIAEYAQDRAELALVADTLWSLIGELCVQYDPSATQHEHVTEDSAQSTGPKLVSKTRVLADGSYVTETVVATRQVSATNPRDSVLRRLVTGQVIEPTTAQNVKSSDTVLVSVLAVTWLKLVVRARALNMPEWGLYQSRALLVISSLMQLPNLESDDEERLAQTLTLLTHNAEYASVSELYGSSVFRTSYSRLLALIEAQQREEQEKFKSRDDRTSVTQPDQLIKFRQLRPRRDIAFDNEEDEADELMKAAGQVDLNRGLSQGQTTSQARTIQLTGYSDPIYAECQVHVHQYDIRLEVTVMNQTADTLQALGIEFSTHGDLKLTERPQQYNIGPHAQIVIAANVKVSSTENGIIFGSIVYDIAGAVQSERRNCVVLNEIHIDVIDYITPGQCQDSEFRTMWADFEWENKIAVNAPFSDLHEFLTHLIKSTNMRPLNSHEHMPDDCGFLSVNLYARSVFGEDALANVSVEQMGEKIVGFVRIRSKTQGIAISIGDKISQSLKK
jgi:coatomer subunit beta